MKKIGQQQKVWLIQGYDGLTLIFKKQLTIAFTEHEISHILKRLVSKNLTANEILLSSKRKNMKGYLPLLEVRRENRERLTLSIGENPHYIASVHTLGEVHDDT